MWNKNRYCYTVVSWGLQELNSYEFQAPFATVQNDFTLMAWCWTVVAPLLMHWSCCSLALPGLRLDVHYALCRSCKNYAYHWRVSFLCFNELMLRDYSAISHWFCICLSVTVAIKASWILNLEYEAAMLHGLQLAGLTASVIDYLAYRLGMTGTVIGQSKCVPCCLQPGHECCGYLDNFM